MGNKNIACCTDLLQRVTLAITGVYTSPVERSWSGQFTK